MPRSGRIIHLLLWTAAAVGLLASCAPFAERAADFVFPNLKTYFDTEAPPTPTSYPASSSISAVLGGRGQGLSCSIPGPLEWAMFKRDKDDAAISLQFRQGCVYHDYCYRHGFATYGYTRADCDYSLQQIAYRDCRLISDQDPKECMSRARRVLLGVTMGGGKAFASGEASTYFEFDPMPAAADDYVSVRWVRNAKGSAVNGHLLNGAFVVMHFKRGTVSSRSAKFDPVYDATAREGEPPQPFPSQYIPTPPLVVRNGDEDRLLAVARDNFQNTAIKVVEYFPGRTNPDGIQVIPFSSTDASVFWMSSGHQDELRYWSNTVGFGTLTANGLTNFKLPINDVYRTLQHMPLEGRFFDPRCTETAVLKRGMPAAHGGDDPGSNFDKFAYLTFVQPQISPCVRHAPLMLAAAQENEPLGVARIDNGRDVLVAVTDDRNRVKLAVFDLTKASAMRPLAAGGADLPSALDSSWLRMPPQILYDAGAKTSMIFFSRFVYPVKENEGPAATDNKEKAQFSFRYYRLTAGTGDEMTLAPAGTGSCEIDLSKQMSTMREDRLAANIARAFPVRDSEKKPDPERRLRQIHDAILGNLVERWSNAQLIPGWFVKNDRGNTETGPLDVAVFFHGFSKYSFLAGGRAAEKSGQLNGFSSIAPSYVHCE